TPISLQTVGREFGPSRRFLCKQLARCRYVGRRMTDALPAPETWPAGAGEGGVWSHGRRALTLGLVFTITLVGFESLAVTTILSAIHDDLHDITPLGWVFPAYFLGSLFGVVVAGYDADRRGPARPFVIGLLLFAAGLLGGGLAPSMAVLVGMRALQGVGGGAI